MRIVPVGNKAIQSLQKWIKVRAQLKNINDTSILFLTQQSKKSDSKSYSVSFEILGKKTGAL